MLLMYFREKLTTIPILAGYGNVKASHSSIQQRGVPNGIYKSLNAENNVAADLSTFRDVDLLHVLNRRNSQWLTVLDYYAINSSPNFIEYRANRWFKIVSRVGLHPQIGLCGVRGLAGSGGFGSELSMGWINVQIGLGRIGSKCFAVWWVRLGRGSQLASCKK